MQIEYSILIPLLLQVVGLILAVIIDPYIKKTHKHIMLLIAGLIFSLIAQNVTEYMLAEYYSMPFVRKLVAIYGYCVRPLIIMLFFYIVGENRRHTPFWILIGINTAVYLSALFSKISFSVTEDNHFERGPLSYTCYIVSAVMLIHLVWITYREYNHVRKLGAMIPAFNALAIITSVAAEAFIDSKLRMVSYLTMAVVSSTLFYYIWLHLRFVREHEKALMAEQRIQIMMSQIQPHFLYNTLSTIQALCRIDPVKASEITERFGAYLRQNIDSLNQPRLISISKELEHTKIYSEIEIVRFPNITVEYDIQETDFSVPALTVQPLVENAIRHGVRIRNKGIVKVSTLKTKSGYMITVEDNGKGFDTTLAEHSDGTHIGLNNVRERIRTICGGTLEIKSKENVGTTVTIHLPLK